MLSMVSLAITSLSARTIRSVFLQAPRNAPEVALLYPSEAGEGVEVALPARNLSPEVELPAGDLVLYVLSNPPIEGEEIPAGAQKISIPAAWKNCTIIFIPDRQNKIFPGRAIVVNSTNDNFPKGDTIVYNLSNVQFTGNFGKEVVRLRPKKSGIFKAPLPVAGVYPVAMDCVLPTKEKRTITRTKWVHNPNARQILFVTPTKGRAIPRVWSVLDHRE